VKLAGTGKKIGGRGALDRHARGVEGTEPKALSQTIEATKANPTEARRGRSRRIKCPRPPKVLE